MDDKPLAVAKREIFERGEGGIISTFFLVYIDLAEQIRSRLRSEKSSREYGGMLIVVKNSFFALVFFTSIFLFIPS